ncbi:hypothetical protein HanPSC8_Chr08g0308321 [Helianthus annuus]|nr:hypothetical protein HanPSC8_Chr08g0308321 [Helianthus annuus]
MIKMTSSASYILQYDQQQHIILLLKFIKKQSTRIISRCNIFMDHLLKESIRPVAFINPT